MFEAESEHELLPVVEFDFNTKGKKQIAESTTTLLEIRAIKNSEKSYQGVDEKTVKEIYDWCK